MVAPNELEYFTVNGYFYDVQQPLAGGTAATPQFSVISGTVTFTPRTPATINVPNVDVGGNVTQSIDLALTPIAGQIIGGQLCSIDIPDTPGVQLLSNTDAVSAALSAAGIDDLIYDVSFSDVVYAHARYNLGNFAFSASVDATTVTITDPNLTRYAYAAPGTITPGLSDAPVSGAYVKPVGGIPASDMTPAVQEYLTAAAASSNAYVKPTGGIPASDLAIAVQALLTSAGTAVQPGTLTAAINNLVGAVPGTLATLQQIDAALNNDATLAADLTTLINAKYSKPPGGIPASDMASPVQTSLGLANSALQTAPTSVSGNAGTATKLATPRNINGVPFDGSAAITVADATKQSVLTPTAVKTGAYTAAVNDIVPCDATSGALTVTLPTAPADKARIIVKKIDASANAITIAVGGGPDVFNKASGSTSLSLAAQFASMQLQYAAPTAIWYVLSTDAAGVATKLTTPRNINGVPFDGTTAITVADATKTPLFTTAAPISTNTTPTAGVITIYDPSAGPLSVTLPPLSGLSAGAIFGVQLYEGATVANTITFTPTGSDAWDAGATTRTLKLLGELRFYQVVFIGGVPKWKVIGGNTTLASLDNRYASQNPIVLTPTGVAATDGPAMDAAVVTAQATGRPIYLKPGYFQRTTEWNLRTATGLTIQGSGVDMGNGINGTLIECTVDTVDLIGLGGLGNHLSDFTIRHANFTPTATTGNGISFYKNAFSRIERVNVYNAYNLFNIPQSNVTDLGGGGSTGNYGFFSNSFSDLGLHNYYNSALWLHAYNGAMTGSVFNNVYIQNGTVGSERGSTGNPVDIFVCDELIFNQLNIEDHAGVGIGILLNQGQALFNSLHFERVSLTGWEPQYVRSYGSSQITINEMTVAYGDFAASGAGDYSCLFSVAAGAQLTARSIWIHECTKSGSIPWYVTQSSDTTAGNSISVETNPMVKSGSPAFTALTTSGYANGVKRIGDVFYYPPGRTFVNVTVAQTLPNTGQDVYANINYSGGTTLPNSVNNLSLYRLKNITAAAVTINLQPSQTIDGATTYSLAANQSIDVVADQVTTSAWRIY